MLKINRKILSNGLRLVHFEDKATQMVALNLLYDVGAKDESPNKTGFAHLFEHLMFSGSENAPSYDEPLQNAGGENNAWTNNDITNFYLTVPRQNVEVGFWLESDRMFNLSINERSVTVQKDVVTEEFKQRYLNQPYGDVGHLIRELAYKVHPYRWPTVGRDISHIKNANIEDVQQFYDKFYTPNNAILAVTGGIDFETAVGLTEKWFGSIERFSDFKKPLIIEPAQQEKRFLEVTRSVPVDMLVMAFHMCDRRSRNYYAFDILSDILSNGASSRLYQRLVLDRKVFSSIDAYVSGSVDAGLFHIGGKPHERVSLSEAEAAIWEELALLKEEKIADYELDKVKNKFESNYIFNNISYLNVATNIAWFELLGDVEEINRVVSDYKSISAELLQEIAKSTFIPENSSVLYYRKDNTQL